MSTSASPDMDILRTTLLLDSDPGAAAQRAAELLVRWPGHAQVALLLARACAKVGDPHRSLEVLALHAEALKGSVVLQLELGNAYLATGDLLRAVSVLERTVALDERMADGWRALSDAHFALGDVDRGDESFTRYIALTPEPAALADARVALTERRFDTAAEHLHRQIQKHPEDFVALRMLASIAIRDAHFPEAERLLRRSLEIAPGYALARYELARALHGQQRGEETLELLERLLRSDPKNVTYLCLKAQALRFVARNDEALALIEQTVAAHPADMNSVLLLGHIQREMGRQAEAIVSYRSAIAIRPTCGEAYVSLANLKTYKFTQSDLQEMRTQLERSALIGNDRIQLEFALGKALEDTEQYEESFAHYVEGNGLHRSTIDYDADVLTQLVARTKEVYTNSFFASRGTWGSARRDPVFIVGMPRSGSTLLEQILASHSEVEGTRELVALPLIAASVGSVLEEAGLPRYPEVVADLSQDQVEALAERYLAETQSYRATSRPRFVDKMLANFNHLGLLQLMFPRASIISIRRHPLGCCFSQFKQLFARGVDFSYSLTELGRYYRDYIDTMRHFESVLPGRTHTVYYEQLVAEPAPEVRRLLDYCGLRFEPQCLRFYETRRAVLTISSEQVRRPIYAESVAQWKHYEPWLSELKQSLADLIAAYPSFDS